MTPFARIAELWRYPVKSMHGEQVDVLDLLSDGIAHDRRYAFESSAAPRGKPLLTGSQRARMLLYTARMGKAGVRVKTPQGEEFAIDDPALLADLASGARPSSTLTLIHSTRPLTDVRPIALLSRQTIHQISRELGRSVDPRRFRANIVIDFTNVEAEAGSSAFPEDALVGATLRLADQGAIRITERDPRCRIVILDPDTTELDAGLMKHLDQYHQGRLGIYATTLNPGRLRVGDPIYLG